MPDYLATIAGKLVSAIAQMAMLLILTSRSAPEQLAALLAVYAVASVLAALGDLGLGTLAMREYAYGDRDEADRAVRAADRFAVLAGAAGCSVLLLGSVAYPPLLAGAPLLVWAPTERATENRALRLIAEGRIGRVAGMTAGRRLASLAVLLMLMRVLPGDLAFAFAFALLLPALAAQLLVSRWAPLSPRIGRVPCRSLLRRALPFTLTSISGQMRNLDVPIIVGALSGVPAAAYGLGSRLASPAMLVFSAVSNLVLVRVGRFSRRRLRVLLAGLVGVAMAAVALIGALARPLAPVLEPFVSWLDDDAAKIIALVASSYVLAGTGIVLGSICVAFGLQRRLVPVNLITVGTSLLAVAVIAVSMRSALAAALASLICYAAQALTLAAIILRSRSTPEKEFHV